MNLSLKTFLPSQIKFLAKIFINVICGQIDVTPTLLGQLGLAYTNNTMGIDLINDYRDYIYFSADNKLACLDSSFLYIRRNEGGELLYKYRLNDTKNYISQYPERANEMRVYASSHLQVAQWMILNKKVSKK